MNNKEIASQDELLGFFSRVSHDVKNIISTMYANYQLAEMKEPTLKQSAYWSRFKTSIQDLNSYMDRTALLRYSYRCNPTTFNLCDILYALPDICEERLTDADRNISFEFNTDSCMINADYDMLSAALTELLVNAYEATSDNDTITIRLVMTDNATITICNPGFKEISADAFEPFCTTKPNHLGIGLAIVRNVAHTHNGTIKMEPASNNAVPHLQFTLQLPIN